ncbi:MAG: MFS transporter [Quisquiliibacterium sp.]|jgi:MFS family permease
MHDRKRLIGLILVCAGSLMGPLDTAVNVAFPAITGAFGLPLRQIQWVVLAFALTQSVVTLASGRLGDLYGHRRIFAIGMACCAIAHLAAGFAPSFGWLVALRVLQGVSVGLAMACAPALATLLYPPQQKRQIVAIYVTTFSFGLAFGPLVGGLLIEWLGWSGVFWFRVPLAVLVLAGLPWLADVRAAPPAANEPGATSRDEEGVMRPAESQFDRLGFGLLQLDSVMINFAGFAILLLVPYALTSWPGLEVAGAGLLIALYPGGALLGGLLAGRFAREMAATALVRAGLLCAALGLLLVAALVGLHSPLLLGLALAITGIGLGSFQVGYTDATTSMLPPRHRGTAGALVSVTRLAGILIGVTGISALHEAVGSHQTGIAIPGLLLLGYALASLARRRRSGRSR